MSGRALEGTGAMLSVKRDLSICVSTTEVLIMHIQNSLSSWKLRIALSQWQVRPLLLQRKPLPSVTAEAIARSPLAMEITDWRWLLVDWVL
jgi:hypothetical protein